MAGRDGLLLDGRFGKGGAQQARHAAHVAWNMIESGDYTITDFTSER